MTKAKQTKRLSKWFLYGPFILAGVVLIGWRALWGEGADYMKDEIAAFADAQREMGVRVDYESIKAKGFPFFLRGAVGGLNIAVPQSWRYETPLVHIDALPYALDRLIFSAPKEQMITWGGQQYALLSRHGRMSLGAEDNGQWILNLDTDRLSLSQHSNEDKEGAPTPLFTLEDALLKVRPQADNPQAVDISLIATEGRLFLLPNNPRGAAPEEGPAAKSVPIDRMEAVIVALASDSTGQPAKISIIGVAIKSGDGQLSLAGDILRDGDGYPAGAIEIEVIDPAAFLAPIKAAGVLTAEQSDALTGALSLAALAGGGKARATVTLQNGEARLMGMTIATLSRL